MANLGSISARLELNISNFMSNLSRAQSAASQATQRFNGIAKAGDGLTKLGSTLTKSVTTPIVGIGTAAIKTAADFDAQMSKVKAISGATGDDMIKLRNKAKEMGAKTKFSAKEAGEAMEYMGMAGWSSGEMIDGLDGIMNLAAASGEDLGTTSDIVTDALTAFGLQAKDSSRFADMLAKTSTKSNTNVSMLGESFKYVAPLCGTLGWSAEDCATALGTMANSGIKGSQAGTTLKTAMTNLLKPTDNQAALMNKLGISMTNADGTMKSMDEVMAMLRTSMGGLSKDQQAAAAATLFGKEAMSGMLAVINTSQDEYDKLSGSIKNCDGTAQDMAKTMLDNLNGQLTIIKSSLEGLAITFGEILMPQIRKFAQGLQQCVDKLNAMTPAQQQAVVKFAAIAASIGPVIMMIGKLVSVGAKIAKLITWVKSFGAAFSALAGIGAGPIAAIIAGIVALGAAFKHFWDTNKGFREGIIKMFNGLKTAVSGCVGPIKSSLGKIKDAFMKLVNSLAPVVEPVLAVIVGAVTTAVGLIIGTIQGIIQALSPLLNAVSAVIDTISSLIEGFVALFTGDMDAAKQHFSNCWKSVQQVFVNVWNAIKAFFSGIISGLVSALDAALHLMGSSWDGLKSSVMNVLTGIGSFFQSIWNGITSFFQGVCNGIVSAWQAVCNFFSTAVSSIAGFFQGLWNSICNIFSKLADFFRGIWNSVCNVFSSGTQAASNVVSGWWGALSGIISGIVSGVVNFFKTMWSNVCGIFEGLKSYFTGIWEGIKSIFLGAVLLIIDVVTGNFNALKGDLQGIWNNIKSAASKIWNGIKTVITNIAKSIQTVIKTIWNSIKSYITTVLNGIKSVVTSVWNGIKSSVTSVLNGIKSVVSRVWNGIKSLITSVLHAIKSTVSSVWNGIKSTITSVMNGIKSTVSNIWNGIKHTISNAVNNIKQVVSNGFRSLAGAIRGAAGAVGSAARGVANAALNALRSLPSQAARWGRDFVNGFRNGINSAKNAVIGAAQSVANKIKGLLHFSRPDEGPLRDYETWMPDFMKGMAKTLKDKSPVLIKQARAVSELLAKSFDNDTYNLAMDTVSGTAAFRADMKKSFASNKQGNKYNYGGNINIEQIIVRNDNDLKTITRGIYERNSDVLRAKGVRRG